MNAWLGDVSPLVAHRMITSLVAYAATPSLVIAGLALLGHRWEASSYIESAPEPTSGLYADVAGKAADAEFAYSENLLERPVLYWGTGTGVQGAFRRKRSEDAIVTANAEHGHRITYARNSAATVLGTVIACAEAPDLAWLPELELHSRAPEMIDLFQEQIRVTPEQTAERFAIRLSIHAGWIGAPVNSIHAGHGRTTPRATGQHTAP